jgi:hypothetical protein
MKTMHIRKICVLTAFIVASASGLLAGEPQKEDAAFSEKLLSAIQHLDYDAFVANGTEAFHGLSKSQFESVCAELGPKLKTAHVTFLGELNQRGFRVTLWKLSFSDGSDDALATLGVRDGKVGGFWVK